MVNISARDIKISPLLIPGIQELLRKEIEDCIKRTTETVVQEAACNLLNTLEVTFEELKLFDSNTIQIRLFLNKKEVKNASSR